MKENLKSLFSDLKFCLTSKIVWSLKLFVLNFFLYIKIVWPYFILWPLIGRVENPGYNSKAFSLVDIWHVPKYCVITGANNWLKLLCFEMKMILLMLKKTIQMILLHVMSMLTKLFCVLAAPFSIRDWSDGF